MLSLPASLKITKALDKYYSKYIYSFIFLLGIILLTIFLLPIVSTFVEKNNLIDMIIKILLVIIVLKIVFFMIFFDFFYFSEKYFYILDKNNTILEKFEVLPRWLYKKNEFKIIKVDIEEEISFWVEKSHSGSYTKSILFSLSIKKNIYNPYFLDYITSQKENIFSINLQEYFQQFCLEEYKKIDKELENQGNFAFEDRAPFLKQSVLNKIKEMQNKSILYYYKDFETEVEQNEII